MLRKKTLWFVVLILVALIGVTMSQAAYTNPVKAAAIALATKDPCRDDQGIEICPFYISFDTRVNPNDPLATITGYCQADRSFQVYSIINSEGLYLATATPTQMINGLAAAVKSGRAQVILDIQGMQLIALPTNQLQVADNRTGSGYQFKFSPSFCGLPSNSVAVAVTPATPVKGATKPAIGTTRIVVPAVSASRTEAQARIDLNIRKSPSLSARRLGYIPKGGVMTLIARDEKIQWIKVSYGDLTGWVLAFYTNVQVDAFRALPLDK